jgi:hypothetical protein
MVWDGGTESMLNLRCNSRSVCHFDCARRRYNFRPFESALVAVGKF